MANPNATVKSVGRILPDMTEVNEALAASADNVTRDTSANEAARDMLDAQMPDATPNTTLAALAALPSDALAALLALATSGAASVGAAIASSTAWPHPALRSDAYKGGVPLSTVIVAVKRGAKSEGSQAGRRYMRYPACPFTLADVLKIEGGPNTADFLYDLRKGFIVAASVKD
jgi:hypothetical protein